MVDYTLLLQNISTSKILMQWQSHWKHECYFACISSPRKNFGGDFCLNTTMNIFNSRSRALCGFLFVIVLPTFVAADSIIPEWTKYPFFFVGASILASCGWFLACCCCLPIGCTGKIMVLFLTAGLIALYGYFCFGPWFLDVIEAS